MEYAWRAVSGALILFLVTYTQLGSIRNMADDAQAQFDSAFAQAAVKPPKVIDPFAPLPHYPQQRYIDKNLAPEKNLTYGDVGALAEARRVAESTGVLPRELGDHMLPMAMTEGREGNFGINSGNAFRAIPATLERAKKLDLAYTDLTDPAVAERHKYDIEEDEVIDGLATGKKNYYRRTTFQGPNGPTEGRVLAEGPPTTPLVIDYGVDKKGAPLPRIPGNKMLNIAGSGDANRMARVMALMLAEKHAAAKGDVVGAVKGYNGAGPMTEQYFAKVQKAKELLLHPKNAPLMQFFNASYLKK